MAWCVRSVSVQPGECVVCTVITKNKDSPARSVSRAGGPCVTRVPETLPGFAGLWQEGAEPVGAPKHTQRPPGVAQGPQALLTGSHGSHPKHRTVGSMAPWPQSSIAAENRTMRTRSGNLPFLTLLRNFDTV